VTKVFWYPHGRLNGNILRYFGFGRNVYGEKDKPKKMELETGAKK
jgi:hypothetical protein